MRRDDSRSSDPPAAGPGRRCAPVPGPDAWLVQQLRQGDPEAGRQFVRENYPGVYRYLLSLGLAPSNRPMQKSSSCSIDANASSR